MPEKQPPIDLHRHSLEALERAIGERSTPPVEKWDPAHCGHSGIRILRDGRWLHRGTPIDRPAMVRLFSTVLRREPDGSFVLVTPVEKLTVDVDGTPFRAIDMKTDGTGKERRIALALDSGDAVIVGAGHPLRLVETDRGPSPRVLVRRGLEAEISRRIYYELAEIALAEGEDPPGVWSDGGFFALGTRP